MYNKFFIYWQWNLEISIQDTNMRSCCALDETSLIWMCIVQSFPQFESFSVLFVGRTLSRLYIYFRKKKMLKIKQETN